MRRLIPAILVLPALLGGCDGITAIRNFAADPKTTQAVANLRAGATIFICGVADAQALASSLEPALGAGQSITGTGNKVLAASTAVCSALQGSTVGSTTAVSGQAVATSATTVATVQ